jgi:hypothetical protein
MPASIPPATGRIAVIFIATAVVYTVWQWEISRAPPAWRSVAPVWASPTVQGNQNDFAPDKSEFGTSPIAEAASTDGRYFPPSSYVQFEPTIDPNYRASDVLLVVSAWMDTRPLLFAQPAELTLFGAAGYQKWANQSRVRVLMDSTSDTDFSAMILDCSLTLQLEEEYHKKPVRTCFIRCPFTTQWETVQTFREFSVCVLASAGDSCADVSARVPVSLLPFFPDAPKLHSTVAADSSVAICMQPMHGNVFDNNIRFFLWYYKQMGVHTVIAYNINTGDILRANAQAAAKDFGIVWDEQFWCPVEISAGNSCPNASKIFEHAPTTWHQNGQSAAQYDCLLRATGRFRWVLFVDVDEFITLRTGPHMTLPEHAELQARLQPLDSGVNTPVLPASVVWRTQFFSDCPYNASRKVQVSFQHVKSVPKTTLAKLPYPIRYQTTITHLYPLEFRTKFMCNPLLVDVVNIHFVKKLLCQRFEKSQEDWPLITQTACSNPILNVDADTALCVHDRIRPYSKSCITYTNGVVDWSFGNRALGLLFNVSNGTLAGIRELFPS